MTPLLLPILARSADDQMIKFVFGAIVAGVWIIGAIISAINKKVEEAKRRQQYGGGGGGFAAPPPLPQQQQVKQRGRPQQQKQKRKAAVKPVAPQVRTVAAPTYQPLVQQEAAVSPAVTQRAAAKAAATASPSQIGRLLRRPDSLRAAFILNEVLSPPISIRSAHTGRPAVY